MNIQKLSQEAIELLKTLIATQSFSGEEESTAKIIAGWFEAYGIPYQQQGNNIYAFNEDFDEAKPTLLLNSHHDTVKPNSAYTKDPFEPIIEDEKLYGLGSNDAGGCLVSLIVLFTYFYKRKGLRYNLVIVASAEEENSGSNGLNSVLPNLPPIDVAIVGEPTQMQLAVAEKGLLVLDCYAHGTAGHAAHGLGENAIYKAVDAIHWFKSFEFPRVSKTLGKIKMTVTQINAGSQHNVIPAECHFVVDIRITDEYSNVEVLDFVKSSVNVEVKERSLRLNSSSIPMDHDLVKAGIALGRETYGSPTLSDQAVLSCPSLKMGPGDSLRSHTADEFIYLHEIEEGIQLYIDLLERTL
ncbi:M20 family metallo-hydrolase [Flavobacteriaceae bacterium F08102]|nr:M20 family metallo-hydrolase [Flavobacteriaceae bacterium F08102]